jgi:hypothetical protein
MKHKAIKRFRDVESGAVFNIGDEIEILDPKRYQELKESGYIEPKKRGPKKK